MRQIWHDGSKNECPNTYACVASLIFVIDLNDFSLLKRDIWSPEKRPSAATFNKSFLLHKFELKAVRAATAQRLSRLAAGPHWGVTCREEDGLTVSSQWTEGWCHCWGTRDQQRWDHLQYIWTRIRLVAALCRSLLPESHQWQQTNHTDCFNTEQKWMHCAGCFCDLLYSNPPAEGASWHRL